MTAGVVVDLRVVVLVSFLHSVVIVVVIDSYGLLVVVAVLYVHLVHCTGDHLTVLLVVGVGVWGLLLVLLVFVLGTVRLRWLTYVHCPVALIQMVVRIVVPSVQLVVVLWDRRRSS